MIVWRTIFTKKGEAPAWYFDAKQGDAKANIKALKDECKRDGFDFEVDGPTEIKVSSRQALAHVLETTAVLDKSGVGDLSLGAGENSNAVSTGEEANHPNPNYAG